MVALEREGYLVQPHTSAGRIPTDKGYRFFVDQLTGPGVLGPEPAQAGHASSSTRSTAKWRRCSSGPRGCSPSSPPTPPSSWAPRTRRATIRSVQLVGLSPLHALLVVVLSDGAVEKRTIDLQAETSEDALARAGTLLASHLVGRTLDPALDRRPRAGRPRSTSWSRRRTGPSTHSKEAWTPTRSSWAGRPAWPSPSTPSRPCAPSWPSSSSSWWSSRCCATCSTAGSRWPSGPSTASSRCRRAPSSWRRCRSTGRTSARWGCSVRRAWTTPGPWPRRTSWASASGQRIGGGNDGRH